MVFATEFNPREQSQRRPRSQNKRISLQEAAALAPRIQAVPKASSYNPLTIPVSIPRNSKVVPLQVNGAVRHVQLNADSPLSLPQRPQLPLGLRILNRLQQGSTAITGVLVASALVVYGSTVYIDKSTNKAIYQLDTLQGESQQLTSANESIKQSLAEQASRPESGLEPYAAGDVLFVEPASPRKKLAKENPTGNAEDAFEESKMPGPLGY